MTSNAFPAFDRGPYSCFQHKELWTLFDYWRAARGARALPSRHDIDPLDLGPILSGIWLCDYEAEHGTIRYRLAGEAVSIATGLTSVRGKLLSELVRPDEFDRVNAIMLRILTEPAIFHTDGFVYRSVGRYTRAERLALPLSSDGDKADGMVGITVIYEGPGAVDADLTEQVRSTYLPVPD
ncbi:MAG: PAS domain-containing protein [Alphaproteobacteria bacterium]|nr:PAS domain-containing protein [Alphaproteobacteria bacterium]